MAPPAVPPPPSVDDHVRALLLVADQRGLGISAGDLPTLLPEEGPATADGVVAWLQSRPDLATLSGGRAFAPGRTAEAVSPEEDEARARRYSERAAQLLRSTLAGSRRWLATVAITGSTAYGRPADGEDCDFFTVVRDGALWLALLSIYLRLRVRGPAPTPGDPSKWCFNYVVEASEARREFGRRQGFLFAREALTARPVLGAAFYRDLVAGSPWIAQEAPRLFAAWTAEPISGPSTVPPPAPWPVRALNALVYLPVAAYLQAVGLRTNHRYRRAGRSGERFRTVTQPRRLAIESAKFERLAAIFRSAAESGSARAT